MTDPSEYTPPKVWSWNKENGGRFANINRPIAGPTHDKELPVGRHPLQLYSLATPNGVKVTVMLEELLALGHRGAEYDAWLIRIDGNQFGSGFVAVNPNSKIPALMDHSGPTPIRVFESGSILLHLAEKFGAFLPTDVAKRAECLSWLFWQMGSAPYLGGGFGHFYAYAPTKIEYAIDRFAMEVKRQLDVLDRRLADNAYVAGDDGRACSMARANSWACRSTKTCSAGQMPLPHVRPCGGGEWSTAPGASPQASCTNATTPAISKPGRKTRLRTANRRPEHDGRRRDRYQIGAPRGRGARHHAGSESALPLARSRLCKLISGARPSYPCDPEE
jgi:GST-like protein